MDSLKPPSKWMSSAKFAAKAALLYAAAGASWIVITDLILNLLFTSGTAPVYYQMFKGWGFVGLSAILGYFALRFALRHVEQIQRELAERERRMRHAIRDMSIMMSALDEHGRFVMWNRECARVTGYKAEEVINRTDALDVLYPDPAHRQNLLPGAGTPSDEAAGIVELKLRCKSGETRTILWHNLSQRFPIVGWSTWGIGQDVTEQRATEQRLREAHERLSFHVNNSPMAIIEWDSELCIRSWSAHAAQIFGWPEAEALGKHWTSLPPVYADDLHEVEQKLKQCMDAGAGRCSIYNRNYRSDGRIIHCEWYNSFSWSEDGKLLSILSQVLDVTPRVQAEDERARLEAQIQHTQKLESLGVLAGGIAHDFNNLLVGVLGNTDMALMTLPQESPVREHLNDVITSAQHAAELCKQMLAYSGKGRFVVEHVNINEMVHQLKNLLQASVSKKARIELSMANDLPLVEADASQLRQVLMNLIINASDSLGEDEGSISVTSQAVQLLTPLAMRHDPKQQLAPGLYAKLQVTDTGCGMDTETQEKIFDPFFTTKFTGRGLGLAAVLGIIRGHRAGISVESEPGKGTTFTLLFPAAQTPEPFDSVQEEPAFYGGDGRVLVVDDEELVCMVAKRALERAGYQVLTAKNGQEAVQLVRKLPGSFCVVVLDMTMPIMNGQETLQAIRALDTHVPIILTSGYSEEETRRRMAGCEFNLFLQKPFRSHELLRAVNDYTA